MKIELNKDAHLIGYDDSRNQYIVNVKGTEQKYSRSEMTTVFGAKSDDLYQARVNSPKTNENKNTLSDKWMKTHIIR